MGLALFGFSCTARVTHVPSPLPSPPKQVQPIISKDTTKRIYGYENIYLKNFYDLKFEKAEKTYELPSDLGEVIDGSNFLKSQVRVENKDKFKKNVLEIAENLGYTEEKIKSLAPKEALELSAKIVVENYDYKNVYYQDKSIDEIFEIGKIKCTDYADSVIAVFNLFKETNLNLRNTYVIDHKFCRNRGHAWNTIFIIGEKEIQITYLDRRERDTDYLSRCHLV